MEYRTEDTIGETSLEFKKDKITFDMILHGIEKGILEIRESPDGGTFAACGDHWFWFGGSEADWLSHEEFITIYSDSEIAEMIFATLEGWREKESTRAEYAYYFAALNGNR